MAKLTIADLKKIKEKVHADTALRDGFNRAKITVHMGTCGIASGPRKSWTHCCPKSRPPARPMSWSRHRAAWGSAAGAAGDGGGRRTGADQVRIRQSNKMRQIFKRHVLAGEIQTPFVLARGAEILK